jgi:hypothetical protein
MDDDPPTREELIAAREDLERQLELICYPSRGMDRNPPLEAKLQSMLEEIDECLAAMDAEDARKPPGQKQP